MNDLSIELLTKAIGAGQIQPVAGQHTGAKIQYRNPFQESMAAVVAISGSDLEPTGYYTGSPDALSASKRAFKDARYQTAWQILKHHPKVGEFALNHPLVKKKVEKGPFRRLTYEDRVVRALGQIMVDIKTYTSLRKKGYMNWDNGSYEAAMAIGYGWRRVMQDKVKLTQSHLEVHFETRNLLRDLSRQYRSNAYIHLVKERYHASFYLKNDAQLAKSTAYFQELAKTKGDAIEAQAFRMMGHSSLVDLGLRYQQPAMIESSIENLMIDLPEGANNSAPVLFAQAKAKMYDHKAEDAKRLAMKLAKSDRSFYKYQAAGFLKTLGETQQAANLLKNS